MSWLYYVANPLTEGLEENRRLLREGNLTFRWRRRELEHIKVVASQLYPSARFVLGDMDRSNRTFRARHEAYDEAVVHATESASAAFDCIVASEEFIRFVELKVKSAEPKDFEAGDEKFLAQRIVNSFGELTDGYPLFKTWNENRRELLGLARGEAFDDLRDAVERLLRSNDEFLAFIGKLTHELIERYEIPAVRMAGDWSANMGG